MAQISVRMLGKFEVRFGEAVWEGPANGKARELFCFLLAHSRASFSREQLADRLWAERDACHSRKNLRQVLWRLQAECETALQLQGARLIQIHAERISLNPELAWEIDLRLFEEAYQTMRGGGALSEAAFSDVRAAVESYRGDFLDGAYQDWCLFERERLQIMMLGMLDRLIADCLDRREYDAGIRYGQQLLQYDPASERTHRQLMMLHYEAGDRSAAIRQYERCAQTLRQELDLAPEAGTTRLYEKFRAATSTASAPVVPAFPADPGGWTSLPDILSHLREFQKTLSDMQRQINVDIQLVEKLLPKREEHP